MKIAVRIAVILIVGALIVWRFTMEDPSRTSSESVSFRLSELLFAEDALHDSFNELILDVFKHAAGEIGLTEDIRVNSPYSEEAINIYVVDFTTLVEVDPSHRISTLDLGSILDLCEQNFLALPPRTVLIDAHFLALLVHNCMSSWGTHTWGFEDFWQSVALDSLGELIEPPPTSPAASVSSMPPVESYVRMMNFRYFNSSEEARRAVLEKGIEEGLHFRDSIIVEFPRAYFMPLVAHELAHLKDHTYGAFHWSDMERYLPRVLSTYREELKADELALEAVLGRVDRAIETASNQAFGARPVFEFTLELAGIRGFCEFWRDFVLYESFDGLRGMSAYDLLVRIHYSEYPIFPTLDSMTFLGSETVESAQYQPIKFFTRTELSEIKRRLKDKGSSLTHRHIFDRMRDLMLGLEGKLMKYDSTLSLADAIPSLDKLDQGRIDGMFDPSLLLSTAAVTHSTGEPVEKLRKLVQSSHSWEELVVDHDLRVAICLPENEPGFIRAVVRDDEIMTVRMVLDLPYQDEELMETAIRNSAIYLAGVALFIPDEQREEGMVWAMQILDMSRVPWGRPAMECNYGICLVVQRINATSMIEVVVFPDD